MIGDAKVIETDRGSRAGVLSGGTRTCSASDRDIPARDGGRYTRGINVQMKDEGYISAYRR